jgi:hypothetical protein
MKIVPKVVSSVALIASIAFNLPLQSASAASAGGSCSKAGLTSGSSSKKLVCTKANGKLIWQTATSQKFTFSAEVWADNWFALYINGVLVGQDSVSITTEKSFNSEKISFSASYPFVIGMVTKDFIQNDTGLEYIGSSRQQIGDGGFIAQFTNTSTGKVVAYTSSAWRGYVIHQAPLNVSCEKSKTPTTECQSKIQAEPSGWSQKIFDDSKWNLASVYTKEAVGVKDGYNDINWSSQAQLIWSSDLKIDNTVLWRFTVS